MLTVSSNINSTLLKASPDFIAKLTVHQTLLQTHSPSDFIANSQSIRLYCKTYSPSDFIAKLTVHQTLLQNLQSIRLYCKTYSPPDFQSNKQTLQLKDSISKDSDHKTIKYINFSNLFKLSFCFQTL